MSTGKPGAFVRPSLALAAGSQFNKWRSTKVTISSRLLRLLHRDRSRKQNVVFKMNVLVQIRFEFRQGFVKRLVADTRVGRSNVTTTGLAHGPQCSTRGVVLLFHH